MREDLRALGVCRLTLARRSSCVSPKRSAHRSRPAQLKPASLPRLSSTAVDTSGAAPNSVSERADPRLLTGQQRVMSLPTTVEERAIAVAG